MRIREYKYTARDVDCMYCTEYTRKVCRANGCPWLKERIEAGVIGYREALEETFRENSSFTQRAYKLAAGTDSFWRDEAHRDRFYLAQSIFGIYRKRNTPAYYAALYLLSSYDALFIGTLDCIKRNKIDFKEAHLRTLSLGEYALFKTAKILYKDSNEVDFDELADPEVYASDDFRVAVNAMLISRYGLPVIHIMGDEKRNGCISY